MRHGHKVDVVVATTVVVARVDMPVDVVGRELFELAVDVEENAVVTPEAEEEEAALAVSAFVDNIALLEIAAVVVDSGAEVGNSAELVPSLAVDLVEDDVSPISQKMPANSFRHLQVNDPPEPKPEPLSRPSSLH